MINIKVLDGMRVPLLKQISRAILENIVKFLKRSIQSDVCLAALKMACYAPSQIWVEVGKVCPQSKLGDTKPIRPALISDFCSMKLLGVFPLALDGILVHRRLPPSILSGSHLYSWVERGTVRVKCFA